MSSLALHEEGSPQRYQLKVMSELLFQAQIAGINPEDLVEFLSTQIEAMFSCPPNFNMFGVKAKVWIMRGFYPGSSVFFKLVCMPKGDSTGEYYAKATPLRINSYFRARSYESFKMFKGSELSERFTDKMENSLLGAKHEVKPLFAEKIRMPRCQSPRGLKVFRYKRKKNEKNS